MPVTFYDTDAPTTGYVGAVLDTFEQNLAHDSYFHAVVWDGEEITAVEYRATAYAGGGRAEVDATPETRAAARAWAVHAAADHVRRQHASTITEGAHVRSLTVRGAAKGLTGRVKEIRDSRHERHVKIALVVDPDTNRIAWVNIRRLEVVTPITDDEVTARAERMVDERTPAAIYRMLQFY